MPTVHQKHAASARWVALTDAFERRIAQRNSSNKVFASLNLIAKRPRDAVMFRPGEVNRSAEVCILLIFTY
jgi:hypothetical protein